MSFPAQHAAATAMQRANLILSSPEAHGREALARDLATSPAYSSLTADAAIAVLRASPKAGVQSRGSGAPTATFDATAAWDRAIAKVNRRVAARKAPGQR